VVVLIGVWVIFLPGFVTSMILLLTVLAGGLRGGPGLLAFWLSLAGGAISSTMLYRVTRNFLHSPKSSPVD
jgi:hypothetical protein